MRTRRDVYTRSKKANNERASLSRLRNLFCETAVLIPLERSRISGNLHETFEYRAVLPSQDVRLQSFQRSMNLSIAITDGRKDMAFGMLLECEHYTAPDSIQTSMSFIELEIEIPSTSPAAHCTEYNTTSWASKQASQPHSYERMQRTPFPTPDCTPPQALNSRKLYEFIKSVSRKIRKTLTCIAVISSAP